METELNESAAFVAALDNNDLAGLFHVSVERALENPDLANITILGLVTAESTRRMTATNGGN